MRKLVTIQTVNSIRPIQNADAIEVASVLGWNVVVKKGEFSIGDLALYFEIDSFLPVQPAFEFLRKGCYKQLPDGTEGFRLRTVRLRGQLSQGLLLPLTAFPGIDFSNFSVGDEVTDLLGVTKFEPPISPSLAGEVKGLFPSFIRKTDQERIQNLYDDYKQRFANETWEVTVKLDGSSGTYYIKDGEFGVCSRNLELRETEGNTFWKIARQCGIEEVLRKIHTETGMNLAFQGEVIGEGIQGNKEKISGHKFYIFDIFDIDNQRYMTPKERRALFINYTKHTGIYHVPILEETYFPFEQSLDSLLEFAHGPSQNPKTLREGLVFKTNRRIEIHGDIVSFKVISNQFLEKYGE